MLSKRTHAPTPELIPTEMVNPYVKAYGSVLRAILAIDVKTRCVKCEQIFEFCQIEEEKQYVPQRGWWYRPQQLGSGVFCDECVGDLRWAKFRPLSTYEIRQGRLYNARMMGHVQKNPDGNPSFQLEMVLNGAPGGLASTNRNKNFRPVEPKAAKPDSWLAGISPPKALEYPIEEIDPRAQYLAINNWPLDPAYLPILNEGLTDKPMEVEVLKNWLLAAMEVNGDMKYPKDPKWAYVIKS